MKDILEKAYMLKCQECAEKERKLRDLKTEYDMYRSIIAQGAIDPEVNKLTRHLVFAEIYVKIENMTSIESSTREYLLRILNDIE